jgi:hypothetical protein
MVVRGAQGQVLGWNCTPSPVPGGGIDPTIPLRAAPTPQFFGPDWDQVNRSYDVGPETADPSGAGRRLFLHIWNNTVDDWRRLEAAFIVRNRPMAPPPVDGEQHGGNEDQFAEKDWMDGHGSNREGGQQKPEAAEKAVDDDF